MNYWLSIKTMISEGIVEIKCQVVWKIFANYFDFNLFN